MVSLRACVCSRACVRVRLYVRATYEASAELAVVKIGILHRIVARD